MRDRNEENEVAPERRAAQLLADAERARAFAERAPRRRSRGAGLITAAARLVRGSQAP